MLTPGICIFQRFMPPDPSGAGKQAVALAHAFKRAGWRVLLLTDTIGPSEDESALSEFVVRRVKAPPPSATYGQIFAYWVRILRVLVESRHLFDVFHIHTAEFQHTGPGVIARALGKRVVVRSSISGEFRNLTRSSSGRVQRQMLRAANAFVVLSDRIANEYRGSGLPADRLNLIQNGVDTRVFHPVSGEQKIALRRDLGLPEDRTILVYHGVFIERKSLHWLVETMENRIQSLNVTLLLVGGPAREEEFTHYAENFYEQARSSPASEHIIIREPSNTVHRYLQASDVYVLPSTSEGLSNAMLEAMAVGLVPIVSRTSGSEDVIEDGKSGLLFEPRDKKSFLDSLERVLDDEGDLNAARIADGAVARIKSSFSIDAIGRRYLQLYSRLLGRPAQ